MRLVSGLGGGEEPAAGEIAMLSPLDGKAERRSAGDEFWQVARVKTRRMKLIKTVGGLERFLGREFLCRGIIWLLSCGKRPIFWERFRCGEWKTAAVYGSWCFASGSCFRRFNGLDRRVQSTGDCASMMGFGSIWRRWRNGSRIKNCESDAIAEVMAEMERGQFGVFPGNGPEMKGDMLSANVGSVHGSR